MSATRSKSRGTWWTWALLALPYLGLCFPQLYAKAEPSLLGFPFFYWYQLLSVLVTSVLLLVVYKRLKSR